jgi:MFS transporter, ACS family, tartrate transporter
MGITEATRRKLYKYILPILFLCFVVSFLDRTNFGYAGLTMNKELGFTAEIFGLAAGLFSIGYLVFEIPGAVWAEKWSAKKWIVRIMVTWGIVGALFGFVNEAWQFYFLRFLLGLAEGGFVPGVLVFLGHWFPKNDRAKAISLFYIGLPFSQVIGGPLASLLLNVDWLGMSGWRWLFIIEGLMAIAVGIIASTFLKDRPNDVKWLNVEEKEALLKLIELEKTSSALHPKHRWRDVFGNSIIIRVALSMFFLGIGFYGFNYFVAIMTKQLAGLSNASVGFLLAIPFLLAAVFLYINSWHSDFKQERRWHITISWLVGAVGLLFVGFGSHNTFSLVLWVTVAAVGLNSYFGAFWAIPQTYFSGLAAAGGVGLINMVGNMGGFVGPYLTGYLTQRSGNFHLAILLWIVSLLVAVSLILSLPKSKNIKSSTDSSIHPPVSS